MFDEKQDFRCERLPGGTDQNFGWAIRRAPVDRPLKVVSISSDIFGVRTHFFRGRTQPCRTVGCEACEAKMLSRWTGFITAVDQADNASIVFEFTPPGAVMLDSVHSEYGSIRGLQIVAARAGGRVNGKVHLTQKGFSKDTHRLPAEVDIWTVLSHIWGLQASAPAKFAEFTEEGLSENEKVLLLAEPTHVAQEFAKARKRSKGAAGAPVNRMNGAVRPLENQDSLFTP